jgi:hypothetical protein
MPAANVAESATVASNNLAFIIVRANCLAAAGAIREKEPPLMRPKITLLGSSYQRSSINATSATERPPISGNSLRRFSNEKPRPHCAGCR